MYADHTDEDDFSHELNYSTKFGLVENFTLTNENI